jgi:membrane protein implicated in regulation of membrane protease activity
MAKDGLDERLTRWGELFDELALDAETIIRDLSELIGYVASTAMLMLMIGVAALSIPVLRGMEARYVGAGVVIFSICAGNAYTLYRRWRLLKSRYDNLESLRGKLEDA